MNTTRTWSCLLVVCVLVGMGCGRSDRTTLERQGVSFIELKGWKQSTQHGATVFKDPDSRATIAIRSAPFRSREAGMRDASTVVAATETVLRGLPRAHLRSSRAVKDERFQGRTFDVEFTPAGKRTKYERRHTVLIGEMRIYHVWLTAPVGTAGWAHQNVQQGSR